MTLRSPARAAVPTSGPGRGPTSDGRVRHRRPPQHGRTRHQHASPAPGDELRRRAGALFGEPEAERAERLERLSRPESGGAMWREPNAVERRESGNGPPGEKSPGQEPRRAGTMPADPVPYRRDTHPPRFNAAEDEPEDEARAPEPDGPDWRERAGLALRERMPLWVQTRCGVERRGVLALAVVLLVAAALAAQHFWAGRTQTVSAPQVVRPKTAYAERDERPATSGAPVSAPASPGGQIVVDVGGKVRAPGIRRLPAGSRVADALKAAGGMRPGTRAEGLNRARFLVDGEQILVGLPASAALAPPAPNGAAGAVPGGAAPAAPVSLNTATAEQLDTLPGVGPVLAQHIIDYRARHGGFRSVDELKQVNGIGDSRFSDLRPLVRP